MTDDTARDFGQKLAEAALTATRQAWRGTVIAAGLLWAALLWTGPRAVNGIHRTARAALWVLFLPLGIFASYRHGKRRDRRRTETLMREQNDLLRKLAESGQVKP